MVTTGRMAYGSVPQRKAAPLRHPWRSAAVLLAVLVCLGLSFGWVEGNWRSFESNSDAGLCHLMQERC